MHDGRTPTAAELDERRREDVARCLRVSGSPSTNARERRSRPPNRPELLDALTAEAPGLLVRLQVCRGKESRDIARALARSLRALRRDAVMPRSLRDVPRRGGAAARRRARAAAFRELAARLAGGPSLREPLADRRN